MMPSTRTLERFAEATGIRQRIGLEPRDRSGSVEMDDPAEETGKDKRIKLPCTTSYENSVQPALGELDPVSPWPGGRGDSPKTIRILKYPSQYIKA